MVTKEEIKKLVIARLESLPSDKKMSIGTEGEFSKAELVESVKRGDAVGEKMIQIELKFLRSLKEGILHE